MQNAIEILEDLVAFDCLPGTPNLTMVAYVVSLLARNNVQAHVVASGAEDRCGIHATIGPNVPGGILLSGHLDVVPAGEGWGSSPWRLRRTNGKLYGRGTADMKGFVAVVLSLVPLMATTTLRAPIHLAFSCDEEIGCLGIPYLIDAMRPRIAPPSAVLVGEPTQMDVVIGHKSSHSFVTSLGGLSGHSSRTDLGVSAVTAGARLITWLGDLADEIENGESRDERFFPAYTTVHCGLVKGGSAANVIAESCDFTTDIRCIPSEEASSYRSRYETHIRINVEPVMRAISAACSVKIRDRSNVPALKPQGGDALEIVRSINPNAKIRFVSYATEAGFFQKEGWDTVVFGPGDIAQAHTKDEFIESSELAKADRCLRDLIDRLKM
ncbi:acetylornithine deacetylase [Mesorhizobium sp.]|uniref:acetylornithine deacetylase n=1 Tax=Mesorhizobium sp. TaxID=1871066 RepID=UPI000FE6DC1B|nr:acetylornithine deacetylase [Mesorhizobium sp.]RWM45461.1 MAG: acetylornithine deacetylase [Mesorhizobium sp.]RWM58219.1 MAG: acetylornithine deacetylase [Mesorhizobium sp.]RWM58616.1 MAG: acetylornithine deacetylase [Mesorhizobium sp.]TIO70085.1 MAG: acetylornithine deacetylase [Mesorhizobium sp.]TJV93977.1 MAG: acetylornithine deacetylase [Mesorhizobium sp.]